MKKKYKLTDETTKYLYRTLYRIEALCNFDDIKIGDKGGFIESENNLSQEGTCWVYDNAKVLEEAVISDGACIYNKAIVRATAKVYNNAEICGNSTVCGNAKIYGDVYIGGHAIIAGEAQIFGHAYVKENANIRGYAKVYGYAEISGNSIVTDYAEVYDNAAVRDTSYIYGKSIVRNNAVISGNAQIRDAIIEEKADYIIFKNWWSSGRHFTWTRSNNMWSVGCFYGTGEQLIEKAYRDSEESGREYERVVNYVKSFL